MRPRPRRPQVAFGHLELLQWLRAEGCPWDECKTCQAAVEQGQVETLRWARENGCPWTAGIRDWAAAKLGYTDDFQYTDDESDEYILYDDDEYGYDEYGYEDSDEYHTSLSSTSDDE